MSATQIVDELVMMTERLLDLIEREAAVLRQGRVRDAAALAGEKTQLVDAYATLQGALRREPACLAGAEPALRAELVAATDRLHRAAGANERAIRAARDVNARLMDGIVRAASAEQMRGRAYGQAGAAAQPTRRDVVSIAVDRRL